MAENILNKAGQNILEGVDKQLYKSTGGILGKPNKYARPWPQTNMANKGFLPISTISPFIGGEDPTVNQDKLTQFEIKDWRGRLLTPHPGSEVFGVGTKFFDTIDKMKLSKLKDGEFPISSEKLDENRFVMDPSGFTPYSTRDIYKIFNDTSTDYFKHGIYIDRQNLNTEDGNLTSTPEENNDPVIFGFDLIIDTVGSPLLNGAIDDFLIKFQTITEIGARIPIFNDFKKQFIKLFKTNSEVPTREQFTLLLKNTGNDEINKYANADSVGSYLEPGKKAYMSYYLKKIGGLKNLSESNGSDSFKYLTDYKKDLISLTFLEDVSLTLGTLSNLYKLLYWSKVNGKSIIPENLLKFNCKIVVSELRNFSRVKASGSRVDVIKDNLSRYVYDLKECQLFFDTLPHGDEVSNVDTSVFEDYSVNFNYKFSSMSFERFNPKEGRYKFYNNSGMFDSNGKETIPFFGVNSSISGNGIDKEVIIKNYGHYDDPEIVEDIETPKEEDGGSLQKLKEAAKKKAIKAGGIIVDNVRVAAQRKLQSVVNTQVALLNQSVNKVLNAVAGTQGIKPPTNVYDNGGSNGIQNPRFFYDVRGQLADFAGDSISGILGGG